MLKASRLRALNGATDAGSVHAAGITPHIERGRRAGQLRGWGWPQQEYGFTEDAEGNLNHWVFVWHDLADYR